MLLTSSWVTDLTIFLTTAVVLAYIFLTRKFNYWKDRNVFFHKPTPFFGNFKDPVLMKTTIGEWLNNIYNISKVPYFGIWVFDEPILVIKDPVLIKHVMIKDFNYFTDRTFVCPEHDEIEKYMMFVMKGTQWKETRAQFTSAFTSGKLKIMFPTVSEKGERLQKYLTDNEGILEAKEIVAKYATDVIVRTFFGINANCFDNEDAIFRIMGRNVFEFSLRNGFVAMMNFSMPNLAKLLKVNSIPRWIKNYFSDGLMQSFEAREKTEVKMNDFIDILKDIKKKELGNGKFDINKIKGTCLQFFMAGFETTSSTIAFTLHELCLNKRVQDKLREEIQNSIIEHKELTYEALMEMKYLDMVVKETLRKYPVFGFLDRRSLKDYKLPGTDLVVEKGTAVYIPVYGLHYDEKYFPEPQKFYPERFAETNYNSDGLVYLPFGEGPRICIGERFGLMSTKLGIISVLSKFEVEKCETTPDPIEFEAKSLVLLSKVGLPMRFKSLAS